MKRLVLINPVNPCKTGLSINNSSRFPPLGLGIVAALTPANWAIKLIDENIAPFEYMEADLVGITAFTSSAKRAYDIASVYRKNGIPVVMGGIHASMLPEEALSYVDAVVVGEAESVWQKVLNDFEAGKLSPVYKGDLIDLDKMPSARHDLFSSKYLFSVVQTARGCPMDCDFCSVTPFNGRRYRQRPISDVLDELEIIPKKKIFFVDDNIIGYGKQARERAVELFKGMIQRKLKKEWFCQASINFAEDEEVLRYAAQSGCRMVFLGLEAESNEALGGINKKLNIEIGVDRYKDLIARINRFKIAVLGAFIYGMDTDTLSSLEARTKYMIEGPIDVMQSTVLTPLPGTKLYKRLCEDKRLLYHNYPQDWNHYDMTEVVFQPKLMKVDELANAMDLARKQKYRMLVLGRKFFKTLAATKSLATAIWALSSNINYAKVAKDISK